MISTADPYRQALASYAASNANYQWESAKKEWDMFELIGPLLESLSLVTTNIFYPHIVSIKISLRQAMTHKNKYYRTMGELKDEV